MSQEPEKSNPKDEKEGIPWGTVAAVAGGVLVTGALVAVACTGVGAVAEAGVGAAVLGSEAALGTGAVVGAETATAVVGAEAAAATSAVVGTETAVAGAELGGLGATNLVGTEVAGLTSAATDTAVATETATSLETAEGLGETSQVASKGGWFSKLKDGVSSFIDKARDVVGKVHDTVEEVTNHPVIRAGINANSDLSAIFDNSFPEKKLVEAIGDEDLTKAWRLGRIVHNTWEHFHKEGEGASSKHKMPENAESEVAGRSLKA